MKQSLSFVIYDVPPNLFMMIIISEYISKLNTYFSLIFDLKLIEVNTALNVENSLS